MSEQVQDEKIELEVVNGKWVKKPEQWVTHRRSKNYLAKITGVDSQFGLRREFIDTQRVGQRTFFDINDFTEGDVYELKCIYYSARGREHIKFEGFLLLEKITSEKLIFRKVGSKEVMDVISQKYAETIKIKKEQEKLRELEEQKRRDIETLEALKQAREILSQPTPGLDVEEVKRVKEELKNRIRRLADMLVATGDAKRHRYDGEGIRVREDYVCIDGAYVISKFENDVGLMTLLKAYRRLVEEVERKKVLLEEIRQVVSKNGY